MFGRLLSGRPLSGGWRLGGRRRGVPGGNSQGAPVPVNTVQPVVSGTATEGEQLSCTTGTWTNSPTSYSYQWYTVLLDESNNAILDEVYGEPIPDAEISGATSSTYTIDGAYVGERLTCGVIATNAQGDSVEHFADATGIVASGWTYIVDELATPSDATGIWALRKLRSAYAGNCVRIRRSSDNSEQDFGFVDNVVDTAGIASFVGGGSGYCVTWYDQSGNGLNVTQSTTANQPLFVASGIGSKPALDFDGSNDGLSRSSVAATTLFGADQVTIMIVKSQDTGAAGDTLFQWGDASSRVNIHAVQSGTYYFDFGTTASGRVSFAEPTGWRDVGHVLEMYRAAAGTQQVLVDGTSKVSASKSTGPSGTLTLSIGTQHLGGSGNTQGYISEIIVAKTDIGSSDRSMVRADLGTYFGITVA